MTIIHIDHFMGMAPRYGDRKLLPNQAKRAMNVDLFSREFRTIAQNLEVNSPTKVGTIQSIYPLNDEWLHWITDVDVVAAPLQTDQDGRIYYTGDYNPKSSNNALATVGAGTDYPLAFYRLGLPYPETAPSVGVTGGAATTVPRSYVYTFMTAWGEEGPPSDPTEYTGHPDGTWNITGMDTAPLNTGSISAATHSAGVVTITLTAKTFLQTGDYVVFASVGGMTDLNGTRQITRVDSTHISVVLTTAQAYTAGGTWTREAPIQTAGLTLNLYRTVSGVYKLVASGITTSSYNDTVADADLSETIPSTDWVSPPSDLSGLVVLPNGALAGFYENVLCFSEPYYPHAWPTSYQIPFPYTIVAIAVQGDAIVVGTTDSPYIVIGPHPDSMSEASLNLPHACISKRSMKSSLNSVLYAAADGFVYIPSAGVPELISRQWFKKEDWAYYNPTSMHTQVYDERFYLFFNDNDAGESGAVIFDPKEQDSTVTISNVIATAGYTDKQTDDLYLMEETSITQWAGSGTHQVGSWLSKIFTTARPVCFKCGKVKLTFGDGVGEVIGQAAIDAAVAAVDNDIAANRIMTTGAFAGSPPATYAVASGPYIDATNGLDLNSYANLLLYQNGALVATKVLTETGKFRLPLTQKSLSDTWQVKITGSNVTIHELTVSETMSELSNV